MLLAALRLTAAVDMIEVALTMRIKRVYEWLPAWGQNLCCSFYGRRLQHGRYGAGYAQIENTAYAADEWSCDQLRAFQLKHLRVIIDYASQHVPYYRDLFRSLGLTSNSIGQLEDIRAIPPLTKETVQTRLGEFVSDEIATLNTRTIATSGTTGTGLRFPITLDVERWQWAVLWRFRRRFGMDNATWYAHLFGRSIVPLSRRHPPFWRTNRPGKQVFFSAYHMKDDNLPYYVRELNRRRPLWIQGYPSLLTILAHYILESGDRLQYVPEFVATSSETLLQNQKEAIENAFGTPCRQWYGQNEAVAGISECPEGRLHVDEDLGYVEFLRNPNGTYSLVATGFHNLAFPLIRYETGDVVRLPAAGAECPCGFGGRVVTSIDGRLEDYILRSDGQRIEGMGYIFDGVTTVREAQLIQKRVDQVLIQIVPGQGFARSDKSRIEAAAQRLMGETTKLELSFVKDIKRTKNGKLRLVVSELDAGKVSPLL